MTLTLTKTLTLTLILNPNPLKLIIGSRPNIIVANLMSNPKKMTHTVSGIARCMPVGRL